METCEARLSEVQRVEPVDAVPDFTGLAQDLAGLGQPQADKLGMRLKLAAAHMALPARFKRTGLPPQVDQIVHKARRNAAMARRLVKAICREQNISLKVVLVRAKVQCRLTQH
ncbi:hypothetical protein NKH55_27050 [Mesorhizobium opportunistum]